MLSGAQQPLIERFMHLVSPEPNTGCWLWFGSGTQNGYGQFWISSRRSQVAHKFLYESIHGPIGHGLNLDHLCRVRCCVNPNHLEPVTRAENLRRSPIRTAGAQASAKARAAQSHCKRGHEFTQENTYLNQGKRYCMDCRRLRIRMRKVPSLCQ